MSAKPKTSPAPTSYGAHTAERAAFWRVSRRTMQKWLAGDSPAPGRAAVPVDDISAMLRWVAALPTRSRRKLTRAFVRRVDELRLAAERAAASAPPGTAPHAAPDALSDPDYAAFLAERAARTAAGASAAAETTRLSELRVQVDYSLYQIRLANLRRDPALLKDATETFNRLSGVLHDEELRAQRLGREVGDILPRPEAERLARALMYWLLRGADDLLADICPRLAAASSSGPLYREEVRAIVEPATLAARVLTPFERASRITAGHCLPAWLVAAMREAASATLDDGAALFAALSAAPLPPPPSAPPPPAPPA